MSSGALSALRVFSLSHRSCGLPALGGVVAPGDASRLHASLASAGVNSIVLSTCNRFEIYWRSARTDDEPIVEEVLEAGLPLARELLCDASVRLHGEAAAHHLFRVCSGLESIVLGEAEILGQARGAMEQSASAGSFLRGVFTAAIRTGRSARAETGIGIGALSVASAAIEQLERHLPLAASRILLIGAGETAAKVARQLSRIGVGRLAIANRTIDRAQELAAANRGVAVGLDAIAEEINAADAVIGAAFSDSWIVTRQHFAGREGSKPLVLVDLSMPPVIEPFAHDGVARIDLQTVETATAAYRQRRSGEVPRVEAIIRREMDWLRIWAEREMLRPYLRSLYAPTQEAPALRSSPSEGES